MLAAHMMEKGARLVADDQVQLSVRNGAIIARAPAAIAGQIELRGLGIASVPYAQQAAIGLVADIAADEEPDRIPAPEAERCRILDIELPRIVLPRRTAEAGLLLGVALARHCGERPPFPLR